MPLLNEKVLNDIISVSPPQTPDGSKFKSDKFIVETAVITMPLSEECETKVNKKPIAERIPAFGLLMALISVVCFSLGSVIVKVLTELHTIEVLVFRSVFQLIFYCLATLIYRYPFFGVSGHRKDLALRAISGTISLTCIFIAYRMMPLADASTIHFSSPVFVTIFAFFLLKEKITILQGVTGTITLAGVVIIAKPEFLFGSESSSIVHEHRLVGTVLAVIAALAAAFSMISLRKLKTTPPSVIVMWFATTVVISGLIILFIIDAYVWPTDLRTWLLLLAIGLCGIGDQYFLCLALRYESAGPVSVTRTFNIVLSFIWEVLILSEAIEWTSIVGAALVSSCVLILAMVKWKTENPHLFESIYQFCCMKRQNDIGSVPQSLRGSMDSIDSGIVQSTVNSHVTFLNK